MPIELASTDLQTLVSTVKNTSGGSLFFGFLPPHGKTLAADQQLTFFGDIVNAVNRGDRFGHRPMHSLQNALLNGDLVVQSSPAPIFYDTTNETVKAMYLDSGVLRLLPTSWEQSVTLNVQPSGEIIGVTEDDSSTGL